MWKLEPWRIRSDSNRETEDFDVRALRQSKDACIVDFEGLYFDRAQMLPRSVWEGSRAVCIKYAQVRSIQCPTGTGSAEDELLQQGKVARYKVLLTHIDSTTSNARMWCA